jgi:hypothetical protein
MQNAVAIEGLEIAHQGIEQVTPFQALVARVAEVFGFSRR